MRAIPVHQISPPPEKEMSEGHPAGCKRSKSFKMRFTKSPPHPKGKYEKMGGTFRELVRPGRGLVEKGEGVISGVMPKANRRPPEPIFRQSAPATNYQGRRPALHEPEFHEKFSLSNCHQWKSEGRCRRPESRTLRAKHCLSTKRFGTLPFLRTAFPDQRSGAGRPTK